MFDPTRYIEYISVFPSPDNHLFRSEPPEFPVLIFALNLICYTRNT